MVAVGGEVEGSPLQLGAQAEGVAVEQYAGVALAVVGAGGEGVGLAVGGGDAQGGG
ncbi:hypothetical protein [Streptomyces sp. NPDC093105]|uniref:hypothetical protein n=1 Tax=Streptomyces sp. NPDC093105 TaxID=3366029 RepID=UPI00382EBC06